MASEFVVDSALRSNPKFRDLSKRLAGPANASWALLRLWSFAASNRPDGDLTDIDPAEIPLTETEWKALIDARGPRSVWGFVEPRGEVVFLHDFERSSKFQSAASRRRKAARIAGIASAAQRQEAEQHAFLVTRAQVVGPRRPEETDDEFELRSRVTVAPSPLLEFNKTTEEWLDRGFEWFYTIYPKHEGRFQGRKAWGKLHRVLLISDGNKGLTTSVKQRMAKYITDMLRSGEWEPTPDKKRYIPAPAVFLNQRRWEE